MSTEAKSRNSGDSEAANGAKSQPNKVGVFLHLSSSLAVLFMRKGLDAGKNISVPSLDMTITPDDVMPEHNGDSMGASKPNGKHN